MQSGIDRNDWLWCLHCERFFPASDLGRGERCAFEDCDGSVLGADIFKWDRLNEDDELEHWPKSVAELKKGLVCPLYPEV